MPKRRSTALEKLPADRFTGAQDFAKALGDVGFRHGNVEVAVAGVAGGPWKALTMTFVGDNVGGSPRIRLGLFSPVDGFGGTHTVRDPVTRQFGAG